MFRSPSPGAVLSGALGPLAPAAAPPKPAGAPAWQGPPAHASVTFPPAATVRSSQLSGALPPRPPSPAPAGPAPPHGAAVSAPTNTLSLVRASRRGPSAAVDAGGSGEQGARHGVGSSGLQRESSVGRSGGDGGGAAMESFSGFSAPLAPSLTAGSELSDTPDGAGAAGGPRSGAGATERAAQKGSGDSGAAQHWHVEMQTWNASQMGADASGISGGSLAGVQPPRGATPRRPPVPRPPSEADAE